MKFHNLAFSRRSAAPVIVLCLSAASAWAGQAIRGVPNFQTVNAGIYRGGQPSDEGFRNLAAMGIKTVVDLRESGERSHAEHKLVKALGMRYVSIPMQGMKTPTHKQVSHALKVLENNSAAPVFIHCKRGSDRTGVVLACYRIKHDNWTNAEALNEARGYGMSWYQFPLQRYVLAYQGDQHDGLLSEASDLGEQSLDVLKNIPENAIGILDRIRK